MSVVAEAAVESVSFDQLVVSNRRRLRQLALMLSGSVHTAEDLVQSALTRAYRHWDKVAAADRPEMYLRRMVVNEFLSWRRRRANHEVPVAEPTDVPRHDDFSSRHVQRDAVWRMLARLPKQQRAVLVLRYYEDLPDSEIATVLGCSSGTVRSNAARALASLRAGIPGLDEEALP